MEVIRDAVLLIIKVTIGGNTSLYYATLHVGDYSLREMCIEVPLYACYALMQAFTAFSFNDDSAPFSTFFFRPEKVW